MNVPVVTRNARPATLEVGATDERGETVAVAIAAEHALTLSLDGRELVTLATLGAAPEHLALGYLRTRRLVSSIGELAEVRVDWDSASVAVTSRSPAGRAMPVRDDAAHCDALDRVTLPAGARLSEEVLYTVMERARRHASIYEAAGAVHGCALCSNAGDSRGEILQFVEDVDGHNAVDTIAGWMWLESIDGADKILYTTGRLDAGMAARCAQLGIPFLLSRSGLTQAGYETARRLGVTMIGRCQGRHYLLFTGGERFVRRPVTALA